MCLSYHGFSDQANFWAAGVHVICPRELSFQHVQVQGVFLSNLYSKLHIVRSIISNTSNS
jgi:hypothetical protein